jgi:hypothetical protein
VINAYDPEWSFPLTGVLLDWGGDWFDLAPHTMEHEAELSAIRWAFAKQILASVGVDDARLEDAYATVRREHYLGLAPGPSCEVVGMSPRRVMILHTSTQTCSLAWCQSGTSKVLHRGSPIHSLQHSLMPRNHHN